jgi:ethanolamine utilization protein EutN
MYTGKVVGSVVSTVKDEGLAGTKLLLVQTIENGKPAKLIVAADHTRQAGQDDFVYLVASKEASLIFRSGLVPADAAIVGFIDEYNENIEVLT